MRKLLPIIFICFTACGPSNDVMPKFKSGVDLSKLIHKEISNKHIEVAGKRFEIEGKHVYNELELKLTDAEVKNYTPQKLESLSNRLAHIAEENISNLSNFQLLIITFITSDGSRVSDSSFKYKFEFEIK